MSVTATLNKLVFSGDDATDDFPIDNIELTEADDLEVWLKIGDAKPAKLESGYTIDVGAANLHYPNSGDKLATGDKLIALRNVPATQDFVGGTTGNSNPKTYESAFDRLTLMIQDAKEELSRCVKFPLDESPTADDTDTFITRVEDAATDAEDSETAALASQVAAALSAAAANTSAVNAAASAVAAAASALAAAGLIQVGTFAAIDGAAATTPIFAIITDQRVFGVFSGNRSIGADNGWSFFGGF